MTPEDDTLLAITVGENARLNAALDNLKDYLAQSNVARDAIFRENKRLAKQYASATRERTEAVEALLDSRPPTYTPVAQPNFIQDWSRVSQNLRAAQGELLALKQAMLQVHDEVAAYVRAIGRHASQDPQTLLDCITSIIRGDKLDRVVCPPDGDQDNIQPARPGQGDAPAPD